MWQLLSLVGFLGWAGYIARWDNRVFGVRYPVTLSWLVLILFVAGLGNLLSTVAVTIAVTGVFLWLKQPFLKSDAVFIVLSAICFIWVRGTTFHEWDEFFWGLFAKNVIDVHGLTTPVYGLWPMSFGGIEIVNGYFPGMPLINYYFSAGIFSEELVYWSYGLVLMILLSSCWWLVNMNKTVFGFVMGCLVIGLIAFSTGNNGLWLAYADNITGLAFGLGLVTILIRPKRWITIAPLLLMPYMIKQNALTLTLGLVFLGVMETFRRNKRSSLQFFGVLVVLLAIRSLGWWWFIDKTGYIPDSAILPKMVELHELGYRLMPRMALVFWAEFLRLNGRIFLPWAGLTVFGGLLLFSFIRKGRVKRLYGWLIGLGLTIGSYTLLHWFMYATQCGEACIDLKPLRLNSLGRYMGSLYLGLLLMGLFLYYQKFRGKIISLTPLLLLLFSLSPLWVVKTGWWRMPRVIAAESENMRKEARIAAKVINQLPEKSRIWVIDRRSDGYGEVVLRYLITPRETNTFGWSLGPPHKADDNGAMPITGEEWGQLLVKGKYDYVFVLKTDHEFWARYGMMFERVLGNFEQGLFKVQLTENDAVWFESVEFESGITSDVEMREYRIRHQGWSHQWRG